jgi:VirE-like protein
MKRSDQFTPESTSISTVAEYHGCRVIAGQPYDLERRISIGTALSNAIEGASVTVGEALAILSSDDGKEALEEADHLRQVLMRGLCDVWEEFDETGAFNLEGRGAFGAFTHLEPWKVRKLKEKVLEELTSLHRSDKNPSGELERLAWRMAKQFRLFGFIWAGTYSKREASKLLVPSDLMVHDFDHVPNTDGVLARMRSDPLIFAVQKSPSGAGIKTEIRVPDNAASDHKKWLACFETFVRYVGREYPGCQLRVDEQAKAVPQLMFWTYDPETRPNPDCFVLLPDADVLETKAVTKTRLPNPKSNEPKRMARVNTPEPESNRPSADWSTVKSALESLEPWLAELQDGERYGTWTGLCFSVGHWARQMGHESVREEAKKWLLDFAERVYGNNPDALANAFDKADGQKTIGSLFALAKQHGWTPPWHNALSDPRPKLRLPGTNRLLSDFALELAEHLNDKNIYLCNGEVVALQDKALKPIKAQAFRTWCEQHVLCYIQKGAGENTLTFKQSMDSDDAIGTLDSPQFKNGLRPVRRIFHARLPILSPDNKLMLLPAGYDADSQTLTLSEVEYDPDMPLEEALQVINDLFAEFDFADDEKTPGDGLKPTPRSKSVAVAAAVGLFVGALLPGTAQRPCFIICANAEGAGKGTLAKCCMMPTVGSIPTASKPNDENEIRKTLLTAVREAKTIIFFDNLRGHLSSESLEAFLTATIFEGRKLGVNEYIVAPNLATVFITGNGLTVSPDLRRRSLFVELHLSEERAEDKVFKRPLDEHLLLELRPKMLAALWSLTKHWDRQGRPGPSRSHSAFPSWANIVSGIVEAAGFGCPLERADVAAAADPDGDDMRSLVSAMERKLPTQGHRAGKSNWTFGELLNLAREEGLFETILGTADDGVQIDDDDGARFSRSFRDGVGRREKATLSKVLLRYNLRLVSGADHNLVRFVVSGKGHARRYLIEPQNKRTNPAGQGIHGRKVEHGVSVERHETLPRKDRLKEHANHADHATSQIL